MIDNDARTNYYGIYRGTSRIVINGSVTADSNTFIDTSLLNSCSGLFQFTLAIEQFTTGVNSILSRIVIHLVSTDIPTGHAKLFAGLVEDTVVGNGGKG